MTITSNVLAEQSTPGSYDTNENYFASDFTPTRSDSTIRVTIALQSGSAATTVAINSSTGGEIRLNSDTAVTQLKTYTEDLCLPMGRTYNIRAKADAVLLNFIRVVELFPPAG